MFVGTIEGKLACFTGVINLPLHKGIKRVHRLVVLPEFQGIGLGTTFIEEISRMYAKLGWEMMLTTSTPALTYSLNRRPTWELIRKGRSQQKGFGNLKGSGESLKKACAANRITYSFKYIPPFELETTIREV